jgi:hypothetical protein
LVVDDGIVVTENIFKKVEEGMSPIEAAIKGSNEIFFAVISISITLVAVFLPVIFLVSWVDCLGIWCRHWRGGARLGLCLAHAHAHAQRVFDERRRTEKIQILQRHRTVF